MLLMCSRPADGIVSMQLPLQVVVFCTRTDVTHAGQDATHRSARERRPLVAPVGTENNNDPGNSRKQSFTLAKTAISGLFAINGTGEKINIFHGTEKTTSSLFSKNSPTEGVFSLQWGGRAFLRPLAAPGGEPKEHSMLAAKQMSRKKGRRCISISHVVTPP